MRTWIPDQHVGHWYTADRPHDRGPIYSSARYQIPRRWVCYAYSHNEEYRREGHVPHPTEYDSWHAKKENAELQAKRLRRYGWDEVHVLPARKVKR